VSPTLWERLTRPPVAGGEEVPWELFHENAKAATHEELPDGRRVAGWTRQLPESLPYEPYPAVALPPAAPPALALGEAIVRLAAGAGAVEPCSLSLEDLATLLRWSYGVPGEPGDRAPRAVPSAGSLFPLEIFFHTAYVKGLAPGLYHYDPARHGLRFLRRHDQSHKIAAGLADPRLATGAALTVFVAVVPERSVLLYGDRGYRLALLEAGATIQSLNLAAAALGLASVNVSEYLDRKIDAILGVDGLTVSTVSLVAIGRPAADGASDPSPFGAG
jgi:SagB-type dehydrogenase family enzyme